MDEIGKMVGLPKKPCNLGKLTDDDVIPLVASSAGLPGFLGGGDPILPIISAYQLAKVGISLAGVRGLMMSIA